MKEIVIKSYKYDELSDKAKEKAREWFAEGEREHFDIEMMEDDLLKILDILGFTVKQTSRNWVNTSTGAKGTRHDNCIWWSTYPAEAFVEGTYKYAKGCARNIRGYAPQDTALHSIADQLTAMQKLNGYKVAASMTGDCQGRSTEVFHRDDWANPMDDDTAKCCIGIIHDLFKRIARMIEDEYDYRCSDEAVVDGIEANDYNFHEDGRRFPEAD